MPWPMHITAADGARPASILAIRPAPVAPADGRARWRRPGIDTLGIGACGCSQASTTQAKASLISIQSRSRSVRPARASALGGGDHARQLQHRVQADRHPRLEARQRTQPVGQRGVHVGQQHGGGAVGQLAGIGGGHAAQPGGRSAGAIAAMRAGSVCSRMPSSRAGTPAGAGSSSSCRPAPAAAQARAWLWRAQSSISARVSPNARRCVRRSRSGAPADSVAAMRD